MNEVTLKELKIVVERAVMPVRASMARKRKIREELLAHLVSVFEEEARHGDEQVALEQTKQRFGDPGELTTQLQQAVPRWDRFARLGEAGPYWPGETLPRFAGRITIFTLVLVLAFTLIVLPTLLFVGVRQNDLAVIAYTFLVIDVLTIPLTLVSATDRRNVSSLVPRAIGPLLAAGDGLWFGFTGIFSRSCLRVVLVADRRVCDEFTHLCFACCFAPLAPGLFAIMARQTGEQLRYCEEWASLAIEE